MIQPVSVYLIDSRSRAAPVLFKYYYFTFTCFYLTPALPMYFIERELPTGVIFDPTIENKFLSQILTNLD